MFKLVLRPSQPIGDHPLTDTLFLHSMEVQTFTTERGPPTLAMSIVSSKSFCPLIIWKYDSLVVFSHILGIIFPID